MLRVFLSCNIAEYVAGFKKRPDPNIDPNFKSYINGFIEGGPTKAKSLFLEVYTDVCATSNKRDIVVFTGVRLHIRTLPDASRML
jgi:hypothetical protein